MSASPFDAPLLFDLTGRGEISLTGADRAAFLHNLVTNDVKRLRPGDGCAAAFLTPKGKLLADLTVLCAEDELILDCEPALVGKLEALLKKYLIFNDVTIEDRTSGTGVLHLEGEGAGEILRKVRGKEVPETPHGHLSAYRFRVVRESRGGFEGFDLRVPRGELGALLSVLGPAGAAPSDVSLLESARIEAGIPRWGAELTEEVLPDEAGLPARGFLSYTKGCYIGQETVARIKTYGHVNRNLVGLLLAAANLPAPGAEIRAGEARVGAVTSATLSTRLGRAVALGYVKREHAAPGTALDVLQNEERRPAVVTSLPLPG